MDIWSQVERTKTSTGSYPGNLEFAGILTESMSPTFDAAGDSMPAGQLWGLTGARKKYIHSVGVVGKVKFVPSG